MDAIQMAHAITVHPEVEDKISTVNGPFRVGESTVVDIWLKNGYGVSLSKGGSVANSSATDTAQLLVIRKVNGGQGSVEDYANPVTNDVLPSVGIRKIVRALSVLSVLINDPYYPAVCGAPHEQP